MRHTLTSLDIGTSKVCALVAEVSDEGLALIGSVSYTHLTLPTKRIV